MGRPAIKWGMVVRYFKARGYIIRHHGGDAIIEAPENLLGKRTRNQVLIGHKCSNHAVDELYDCYVQAIKRAFDVSWRDILKG